MEFEITHLEKLVTNIEASSKEEAIEKFKEEHDDINILEIHKVK